MTLSSLSTQPANHKSNHVRSPLAAQRLRRTGRRQAVGQGQPHVHRKAAGGHDWHVRGMLRHQLPRRQQPPVRHQGHHVLPDDDGRRGPPGGRRRPHRCQREPAQPERAVRAPGRRRRRWRQVTNRIRASLASQTTHTHDTHHLTRMHPPVPCAQYQACWAKKPAGAPDDWVPYNASSYQLVERVILNVLHVPPSPPPSPPPPSPPPPSAL